MTMPRTRYFHASPKRFRVGDVLTGGHLGGRGTAHENVCLTDSAVPHATIVAAIDVGWTVYEVQPLRKVRFVAGHHEYQTSEARVIRRVGNAAAILRNAGPKKRFTGDVVKVRGGESKYRAAGFRCLP